MVELDINRIPGRWMRAVDCVVSVAQGSILAGGCLRDLFCRNKDVVKDLDFFVPHGTDHDTLQRALARLGWDRKLRDCIGYMLDGSDGTVARTYALTYMSGQYTLLHEDEFNVPEVNIIEMASGHAPLDRLATFDFGICQIAFDGGALHTTPQFHADSTMHHFTVVRSDSPQQFERTMQRWERLRVKYPEHHLIVPPPFNGFLV